MDASKNSRRAFVKTAATGVGLLSLPGLLQAKPSDPSEKKENSLRRRPPR